MLSWIVCPCIELIRRRACNIQHTSDNSELLSSVRHVLRQQTADQHARLDALLTPLFLGDEAGYRGFLSISAAALVPLEQALVAAGVDEVIADWPTRARTPLLLADLAELSEPLPPPVEVPKLDGHAQVLGVLYVLEGSRLGARQLLRTVAAGLETRTGNATRYLAHGHAERLWQSFVPVLNGSAAARAAPDQVVHAANLAFGTFHSAADRYFAEGR